MRVSSIKFAALFALLLSASAWGRPPYAVVGYCYTTTKASTTSLNGSGGAINWTTDIPWNDLTVIADAFMVPNTNGTFSNGGAKNATLVNAAHAQGVRCIVSIGGGGQDGSFTTLCLPANRAAFATAIANLVTQYNYDGVDIDWETPTNQQADATVMMEDIYNDLKALPNASVDNKPRTLSFTTVDYIDQVYNMTTLANYTDWCFFMGYDWYACPSLANGPLNSIQSEIASLTNGSLWSYPISKMVLGCPLYTNDYNPTACTANEYNTLSILHMGTPGAYNSTWAEQAYTAPNGDTVYVDTAQSYCDKTNWALGAGLMGIGMWDIGLALPYTDPDVSGLWNTIGGTASCLGLGPTNTPTVTPTPVVLSTWRVNAGGPAYTDSQGKVWAADENFNGGTAAAASTNAVNGALPGAADQALYQTQRYGPSFTYSFNVPAGSYQVTLKFAETYFTTAGSRIFNVSINGAAVLTNFDVFSAAGGANIAIDKVYDNIAPSGGTITLQFGPASADNAVIQAIQIIPEPSPSHTPTRTGTSTLTPTRTATPSPTRTRTATQTPLPSSTPSCTASATASPLPTHSSTALVTASSTAMPTLSATATAVPTHSSTAWPTASSTIIPTLSATRSPAPTHTSTALATASATVMPTLSATALAVPTHTSTALATASATAVPTLSATAMAVPTHTATALATASATAVPTLSATAMAVPTHTATALATASATAVPTLSATAMAVPTHTSTPTMTATDTTTATRTATDTATATASATSAATPTLASSATASPSPDATMTATLMSTVTAPPTASSSPTAENTPTAALSATSSRNPVILQAEPVPNPNPTGLAINLDGQADHFEVKIYSAAYAMVLALQTAGGGPGWVRVAFPPDWSRRLPRGTYYFRLIATKGVYASSAHLGRILLLR